MYVLYTFHERNHLVLLSRFDLSWYHARETNSFFFGSYVSENFCRFVAILELYTNNSRYNRLARTTISRLLSHLVMLLGYLVFTHFHISKAFFSFTSLIAVSFCSVALLIFSYFYTLPTHSPTKFILYSCLFICTHTHS